MSSSPKAALVPTLAALVCAFAACAPPSDPDLSGGREVTPPASYSYVHTIVPWLDDQHARWYLVDTGSPRSMILPRTLGLPDDTFEERTVEDVQITALHRSGEVPLIVSSAIPDPVLIASVSNLGGVVGADLLAQQPFTLDPRAGRFTIGAPDEYLYDVGAPIDVPVLLRGGGGTCFSEDRCIEYGPTRLIVPVDLEGEPAWAMVDTGATYVSLLPSLFDRLPPRSDRPTLHLLDDDRERTYSRVASIHAGDATLANVPVQMSENLQASLARLHVETGIRVEVILGHSFLMYFAAAFDHAVPSLRLHPYDLTDHVTTENFTGLGIRLAEDDACYRIEMVVLESPIVQGLAVGDCVVSVDGLHAGEVPLKEVRAHLNSLPVGAEVPIEVDKNGSVQSLTLTQTNLLPKMDL